MLQTAWELSVRRRHDNIQDIIDKDITTKLTSNACTAMFANSFITKLRVPTTYVDIKYYNNKAFKHIVQTINITHPADCGLSLLQTLLAHKLPIHRYN